MQKAPQEAVTDSAPLLARWHRMRRVYRAANLATHHVLGFTIKLALLAYFLFALLLLVLRYAVLPNIDYYKSDIEQLASKAVGNQVSIARIYASWHGLRPNLFLGDVSLRDGAGHNVLSVPSVSATLSWWSVLSGTVHFDSLEVIRPELAVRRSADGKLYVAGIALDPAGSGDGKGADWLLSQRQIVIRQGRLLWNDELRQAPPLQLENVNLVLRNHWRNHALGLQATPPASLAAPLDVRANFDHPRFASKISNLALWQGELFVDVQQANLAAWKTYLDYPFDLSGGNGSLRAWLHFDQTRLAGVTADVSLSNVTARLGSDLPPLELAQMSGRVTASEEIPAPLRQVQSALGKRGHALGLSHFSLRTQDGLSLPSTTLSERYVAPLNGQPERTEVTATLLDLHTLAELAGRLPLTVEQRDWLLALAPRGVVRNVAAEWQGALSDAPAYHVKATLVGLGVQAQPARPASVGVLARAALPGVENLNATFDLNQLGGTVSVDAPQLVLSMPGYLAEPALPFEQLKLKARWSIEADAQVRVQLDALDFLQQGLSGALHGSYQVQPGKGPGTADLTGSLKHFDVKTIARYLPLQTPPDLRAWLIGALEDGSAEDVSLRLRGDLAQFPFKGESAAQRGEFRVAGRIVNGKLNYAPGQFAADGKAPLWPQAEHIKGSFLFQRARMEIRGDSASTGGVGLTQVKAVIADLTASDQLLEIDGNAYGPMQGYLNYVTASPVLAWIDHFTDQSKASGNAKLALNLRLPLAHLSDAKVRGGLQLMQNDIVLFDDMPLLQAAQGKIEFNEKGVNLPNLSGSFLGGPLQVSGGTQRDNSIQVKLAGSVTADGLKKEYPTPGMQRLATYFDGGARFTGLVTQREQQLQVQIESTLSGVALAFPAPLKKTALETMPFKLMLNGAPANAAGLMRDEIKVVLGSSVVARYEREKQGQQAWRVVRGGIGVNLPAPQPDHGLMLNVSLKSLDVDAWTGLTSAIADASGGAASAAHESGPAIAHYIVPDTMAAHASELLLGGRKLENVVVGASHQNAVWQANIDSNQVSGHVAWNETPSGLGKVTARLSSLMIPASAAGDVKNMLEGKNSAAHTMPSLDIVAERFELFNKKIGRLELQAYNALSTPGREWRIQKLSLTNPDGEFKGSGKWLVKDGHSDTSLNFELDIADAGKLLDRLGFADTVRKGKGKLSGDISWQGLPYALDLPSLSGQLQLNVAAGQFLKQDPGAAKLLGVLSLQALPRLLKFDFHDVFSEGLAFDGISATAAIQHGVVQTDNLKMHGVAATVLMNGTADLSNESSNLHVVVIPEFNLGTGPLVYALAVNPVVGIGSFLAQLFLRAPVMKALTYQMQVTGPWKMPVVTKLTSAKLETAPGKLN